MPNNVKAAQGRALSEEASAALDRLGSPSPIGDPVDELLALAARAVAWEREIRERLSELREYTSHDVALIDRERALVRLYGDAMDRTAKVMVELAKLNLDERRTRVSEIHILHLIELVATTLSHPDLGLTTELQRRARAILAAEVLGHGSGSPTPITKPQVIDAESHAVSPTSAENGAPEAVR
jgi:hypothetical protein